MNDVDDKQTVTQKQLIRGSSSSSNGEKHSCKSSSPDRNSSCLNNQPLLPCPLSFLLLHLPLPSTNTHLSSPSNSQFSPTTDDSTWWKNPIQQNKLHDYQETKNNLRKGINPRTRDQQLQDLLQYKGISHYEEPEASNHTTLPCPGELLVEEHHSNYGEPWAGGRDVFEFLASAIHLAPDSLVLEIGYGTLRVATHFIRFLDPQHFHCLERDQLSLIAAYELPSQGLLNKRPLIFKGEDKDFSRFGFGIPYHLIYASVVFLHIRDKLVWIGLERLLKRLRPYDGLVFVSHDVKFCSRLGETKRLSILGLEYLAFQSL